MMARIGNNNSMPVGAPSCHSNRVRLEEAGSSEEISRTASQTPPSCSSYTPLSAGSSKTYKLQREDHQEICRQTPKIFTQY